MVTAQTVGNVKQVGKWVTTGVTERIYCTYNALFFFSCQDIDSHSSPVGGGNEPLR